MTWIDVRTRSAVFACVIFGLLSTAMPAGAQVAVSPRTSPALGTTIRGTTTTTFNVAPSGTVTRTGGNAIRLSNAAVFAPSVSLNCGLLNLGGLCAIRPLRITITPSASTPAAITKFHVANLTGATYRSGSAPTDAQTVVFDLNPLGLLATATFTLGMDVTLQGGASSGTYPLGYTVTVQLL